MQKYLQAVAALLFTCTTSVAFAIPIGIDEFSVNVNVETFESLPRGFQSNPLDLNGIRYSSSSFLAVDNGFPLFANLQPPGTSSLTMYAGGAQQAIIDIDFSDPVRRAGMLLSSGSALSWIVTSYGVNGFVEQQSVLQQLGQALFVGFANNAGIARLRFQQTSPNTSGAFTHFDDLRYDRIVLRAPEPATAALFGAALLSLGWVSFFLRRNR